jgi:hypothetical protein
MAQPATRLIAKDDRSSIDAHLCVHDFAIFIAEISLATCKDDATSRLFTKPIPLHHQALGALAQSFAM